MGIAAWMLAAGCGIAVRRDLSTVPPGQVGFDDMCGLQPYFDALAINTAPPPRVVSAVDLEGQGANGKTLRGGHERFAFESDFQLKQLRRILNDNWQRLPDEIQKADKIEIEVRWSEKAGAKRVTTDQDSEIAVGSRSWDLPYQACISELLYGEPLYKQRREIWGLPLPAQPPRQTGTGSAAAIAVVDGGVPPPAPTTSALAPSASNADAATATSLK
jgi:hypothetical protein